MTLSVAVILSGAVSSFPEYKKAREDVTAITAIAINTIFKPKDRVIELANDR